MAVEVAIIATYVKTSYLTYDSVVPRTLGFIYCGKA